MAPGTFTFLIVCHFLLISKRNRLNMLLSTVSYDHDSLSVRLHNYIWTQVSTWSHQLEFLCVIQWRIQDLPDTGRRQRLILYRKVIIWRDFDRKLHENERNWTGGGTSLVSLLDPTMELHCVYEEPSSVVDLGFPRWQGRQLQRWSANVCHWTRTINSMPTDKCALTQLDRKKSLCQIKIHCHGQIQDSSYWVRIF